MGKRKKGGDSEADYSSDEEAYEDPVDAFYSTKGCAKLDYSRRGGRNREKTFVDIQKEEDRINKMLEEQSDDKESAAEHPEDEDDPKAKGRATGKDLVPCELHPLDHMIECIIADRIKSAEISPSKSKKRSTVKNSQEETKDGSTEKHEPDLEAFKAG